MEPTIPADHIDHLPGLEKQTLQYIIRTFGHSPFLLDDFLHKAPLQYVPAQWHIGLIGLCQRQIVSVKRKTWGERLFHVPVSFYFAAFRKFYSPLYAALERAVIDAEEAAAEAYLAMPAKALLMLLELEHAPLKFTRKGTLQKHSRDRLLRALAYGPQDVEDNGRLPRSLEEALDLMLRMGIVHIQDGIAALQQGKFMQWLAQSEPAREEQMFMLWYRVHCPLDAELQAVTAVMRHAPAGKWMLLDEVLSVMQEAGVLQDANSPGQWLERLQAAGWLEAGSDVLGRRLLRRSARAEGEAKGQTLSVQPDFEVIAFPGAPFSVLRELSQFTESLQADVTIRVRLTQQSCERAFAQGMSAAAITTFLQQHAADLVPDHIVEAISAWEHGVQRIRLMKGVLLQTDSEAAAVALQMSFPEHSLRRIAPSYWLVAEAEEQAVLKLLKQQGVYVEQATGASQNDDEVEEAPGIHSGAEDQMESTELMLEALHPDAPGLYKPSDVTFLYRPDDSSLTAKDVYPDHEQIPAMWYKQYRKYHPSTVKQLIKQAIAWRTGIRIRTEEHEFELAPRTLDDSTHPCAVDGYSERGEIRLSLQRIERIKLLLPGILE